MTFEVGFETVAMVTDSWDQVKTIPNVTQVAGELLFRNIFRIAPGAWALFKFGKGYDRVEDEMFTSPDFLSHAKNVIGMVDSAVHFLGPDLLELETALIGLGARHIGYGVLPEHYPVVGQALLETLAAALGDAFTPQVKEAWTGVYGFITNSMLKGASEALLRLSFPDILDERDVTLDECVSEMLPQQKDLYYTTDSCDQALPQVQQLQQAGVTILLLDAETVDRTVTNLGRYLGRKLVNVADPKLDLNFLDKPRRRSSPRCVSQVSDVSNGLDAHQAQDFCAWFQGIVGTEKVTACTPTCGYASLPARVIQDQNESLDQKIKIEDFDCMPLAKTHVEINPSHDFVVEIYKARDKHPELAAMMAEQLHDTCLVQAGLMDDCRTMVNRMTSISMLLLKTKNSDVDC